MKPVLAAAAVLAVAAAGPALARPPLKAPAPAAPLQLKSARIGMSWKAWAALPFPGKTSAHVLRACSDDPVGAAAGLAESPADAKAGRRLCGYVTRYGRTVLRQTFPLDKAYLARDPTYEFTGGRLTRIEFHTSIDAFYHIMAMLRSRYGAPDRTVDKVTTWRGGWRLPAVRKSWTLPQGSVVMVDPSPSNPKQMTIRFSAKPPA